LPRASRGYTRSRESRTTEICSVKCFPRITINPEQMTGRPCIRRIRITVSGIGDMVARRSRQDGPWPTDENYED